MESKIKFLGHPVHQMLIVFPLGLLGMAVIFDLIGLATANPRWFEIAFWMMGAGIVSGLVAAPFGTIDWWAIPKKTRAKRVGFIHGLGNIGVVLFFAFAWWLRRESPESPKTLSLFFSFLGFGLAGVTGWLGGELVNRLGIGISGTPDVNAPSSLKKSTPLSTRVSDDRAA